MNLDTSALRTLILSLDLGGHGKAATKLHRTPGAISLQLKALEDRLGVPLFVREGRTQKLTPYGEVLLSYARQIVHLNDEAILALKGFNASGEVRFGMPQDLADSWLPVALARFARAFPAVRIEIRVGRSAELMQALKGGELDLVLAFGPCDAHSDAFVGQVPVRWIASTEFRQNPEESLPLLLLGAPCIFRDHAQKALNDCNRSWRVALSSSSVSALWSAAEVGLGLTARAVIHVPSQLGTVNKALNLPPLNDVGLFLHSKNQPLSAPAERLQNLVRETVNLKCEELKRMYC